MARNVVSPPLGKGTRNAWKRTFSERAIAVALFLSAFLSILITVGIVAVLLFEALAFFGDVTFWEFITGTRWTPLFSSKQFGVLALVAGTTLTAVLAMLVALPLGLLSAIYLSEYAPDRIRRLVKPI
ncbi:MAG: phosphate ABC transporter permease subunit PstC, partial [SAR202 cluster bacterium]|nr:phosphate ABC transporter permease subunit PstC [SAR202 cluster bacterium]